MMPGCDNWVAGIKATMEHVHTSRYRSSLPQPIPHSPTSLLHLTPHTSLPHLIPPAHSPTSLPHFTPHTSLPHLTPTTHTSHLTSTPHSSDLTPTPHSHTSLPQPTPHTSLPHLTPSTHASLPSPSSQPPHHSHLITVTSSQPLAWCWRNMGLHALNRGSDRCKALLM